MAHATLHFAIGMTVGMAAQASLVTRAMKGSQKLAPTIWRWLWISWLLGLWGIIPSLLRYFGAPDSFCTGWWMNLFLFHPLINHVGPHGTIIGATALVCCFALQYSLILSAIWKASRNRRNP